MVGTGHEAGVVEIGATAGGPRHSSSVWARRHRPALAVAVLAVLSLLGPATACGGDDDDDDATAPSSEVTNGDDQDENAAAASTAVSTTPPETTPSTTAVATTTATIAPPTTTLPAFSLDDVDEETYNAINNACAWAQELQADSGFRFVIDLSSFKNRLLVGGYPPFEDVLRQVDLEQLTEEQLRTTVLPVCTEIGAPTDEFLAQF